MSPALATLQAQPLRSLAHYTDQETLNELVDYQWLVGEEAAAWLNEFAASSTPSHRILQQLRKDLSAERARLVVQQLELRRKAVEKFGEAAARMFFTDVSLQQATDREIGTYKASRFSGRSVIIDYCCGIGGDTIAFAAKGATLGWDRSPPIALLARANLHACGLGNQAQVCVGNVEDQPPAANQQWHLDPDRRTDGRRSTHVEWHSPDEQTIKDWLTSAPNGAIKLAPAAALDADWQSRAELEWISRDRQCRQLIAWFGEFAIAQGQRRATAVHGDRAHSFVGAENTLLDIAAEVGQFVFDTDPAVRAAKLTGALANSLECQQLAPGESYLTSDHECDHPLLTGFQVTEVLPLRLADLAKLLKARSIGSLEIKTRGVATNPEQVLGKLKLSGSRPVTLLLTKLGKREIAILAERKIAG